MISLLTDQLFVPFQKFQTNVSSPQFHQKQIQKISEVKRQMKEVVKFTETIEQELASKKFLEENKGAKVVGLTNKKNLVFENKGKQVKISPEGLLV